MALASLRYEYQSSDTDGLYSVRKWGILHRTLVVCRGPPSACTAITITRCCICGTTARKLPGDPLQAAQGRLDASARINLTDQIRLVLEGVNLDRSTSKPYLPYPSRLYTTLREDRRFFLGVAATF
jgi:hypothetical protein